MLDKVLLVDDDPNILAGFKRNLRKKYDIETAEGGDAGLQLLAQDVEYAVVVSDMQMPEMNGVEFLKNVTVKSPNSVRMMLTGNADQNTAIQAINEGRIFRFLNKPCEPAELSSVIDEGIAQYRLITAEKEILEKTLGGSIKVVCEILSLVNPNAFGKASRIQRIVKMLCQQLELRDCWKLEMAAMLSQLGCVTIPQEVLDLVDNGSELDSTDCEMITRHPAIAQSLLENIPRMEHVANLIGNQIVAGNVSASTANAQPHEFASQEACILQIAIDCDWLQSNGCAPHVVFEKLNGNSMQYWPEIIEALDKVITPLPPSSHAVKQDQLVCGDVFAADVLADDGRLLIRQGQEVTQTVKDRLFNFAKKTTIQEPILVFDKE